jgi:hypothetical protein
MNVQRVGLLAVGIALALAGSAAGQAGSSRGAYSYIRDTDGEVVVESQWNGRVEASRNMPISVGDEIRVSGSGRAEVGLADGNVLYLGGGARARFESIRAQQGEDDAFSMIRLEDGSLILAAAGATQGGIPRIDTEDATVYLNRGDRVRVNYDPRRGTAVIARAGTAEVRTREGRYEVRAGEYLLVQGDEEPEVERGSFSRDRFDVWASDRFESSFQTRSASAQYVDEDYQSDVVALDGYGDWDYSDNYNSYVWRPRVSYGWSPYSNGSWYYTPVGLTWWSYDPWGWYPFHYGNWFFDVGWSSWCWAPAYVYSPAWVYWAYSPGYVGWCPVGWYGYHSPWYNNYYKNWGWTGRGGVYLSVHGTYATRSVDFRGWNFAGADRVGAASRMEIIPGSRMTGRLASTVAVSSRPIVVTARPGEGREAVQSYVREAPRVIERTAAPDSQRLAPVLGRQSTLPADTVEAMRGRGVVAERGRLAGPGVSDIAPRGVLVDRARTAQMRGETPASAGGISRSPSTESLGRSAPNRVEPRTVIRGDESGVQARSAPEAPSGDWRGSSRSRDARTSEPRGQTSDRAPRSVDRGREAAPRREVQSQTPSGDWRGRSRSFEDRDVEAPSSREAPSRSDDQWRSRSSVPPARRVIEGSVPGRQVPDRDSSRGYESRGRSYDSPRGESYQPRNSQPAPREYRSAPSRDSGSAPRGEVRSAPRGEVRSAPSSRSAPAPRMAPAPAAPRSAPSSPHRGRN